MDVRIPLVGITLALVAACEAPQDTIGQSHVGDEPAPAILKAERVGTSPYTNCNFESAAAGENFDTVILNGRVMDPECGFDGTRNVGIKDGRIALITEGEISGGRTIDASGHVVAPGFINNHNHTFAPFAQKLMAHDGTTTLIDTESGSSNVALFYEKYAGNSLLNFGAAVGHEPARAIVLDGLSDEDNFDSTDLLIARSKAAEDGYNQWALDVPTAEQHEQILTIIEQGMRDGAVSISSTVGYMGYGTPTYEMFDLQKVAKKYDRLFGAHTRFGPTVALPTNYTLGLREIIANAVALDGALVLTHIHNQNWEEAYEIAMRLQERGMNIFPEYYPHITGNPNISTPQLLPNRIEENNIDPTKHIYDPFTGELFESREAFFKMQKERPDEGIFIIVRNPEWLEQWIHMKNTSISNDAVPFRDKDGNLLPIDADPDQYNGHPRVANTYGTVFRMAREQGVPLMDIVNNAAYIPAKYYSRLGLEAMQLRGRLQQGMIADITVFNPETIADAATMKMGERGLFTHGIPYVIVNGQVLIDNGVANTDIRPGQPIRYEVITEGDIDLDFDDKKYQWHADLPGVVNSHRIPGDQAPE